MNSPKYILHTTPESNLDKIKQDWFLYRNGYPTVTGSLAFAVNHATRQWYKEKPETANELWEILIMKSPEDKIISDGYKWVINIDEEKKEIHWRPRIRASAKMESWIYDDKETVKMTKFSKLHKLSNKEIKEFAKINHLDVQKTLQQDILAIISPTQWLSDIAWKIRKEIFALKEIDFYKYKNEIKQEIINNKNNKILERDNIDDIVTNILKTTIQQEVVNFVRNLFLMLKENEWYKIFNWEDQISILERHKESFSNLDSFRNKVNHITDGKYDFDLTWQKGLESLNTYLRIQINKLFKEMEQNKEKK